MFATCNPRGSGVTTTEGSGASLGQKKKRPITRQDATIMKLSKPDQKLLIKVFEKGDEHERVQ